MYVSQVEKLSSLEVIVGIETTNLHLLCEKSFIWEISKTIFHFQKLLLNSTTPKLINFLPTLLQKTLHAIISLWKQLLT